MIDIENFVFSRVADVLRTKYDYQDIYVSGEYVDTPARFPAVTIIEADNSVLKSQSTIEIENAVSLLYEVNVFSNQIGYKKSQAKDILETLDYEFKKLGFVRIMCSPTPNLADSTIYRITARYEGVVQPEYSQDEYGMDDVTYRIYTE